MRVNSCHLQASYPPPYKLVALHLLDINSRFHVLFAMSTPQFRVCYFLLPAYQSSIPRVTCRLSHNFTDFPPLNPFYYPMLLAVLTCSNCNTFCWVLAITINQHLALPAVSTTRTSYSWPLYFKFLVKVFSMVGSYESTNWP